MTFKEYWAKHAQAIEPAELDAIIKEIAEKVWDAAFDEGYKYGHADAEAECRTDRGHLNP
jgi:hypothetical protein